MYIRTAGTLYLENGEVKQLGILRAEGILVLLYNVVNSFKLQLLVRSPTRSQLLGGGALSWPVALPMVLVRLRHSPSHHRHMCAPEIGEPTADHVCRDPPRLMHARAPRSRAAIGGHMWGT